MSDSWIDIASMFEAPEEKRIYGVALALVIDNMDSTNAGRVQLRLPWMEGYEPWARVALPMAGMSYGAYFIPQVGDEVLVAFNHGDISEPYVVGSLWSDKNVPPAVGALDPRNKRILQTPAGHKLEFDDAEQKITVMHAAGGQVELSAEKIEMSLGSASIQIGLNGITIKSAGTLTLQGTTVDIKADGLLNLSGTGKATLDGGSLCTLSGAMIMIG